MFSTLELEGVLIQAEALHTSPAFQLAAEQGADLLLTVKTNQRRLYHQIVSQLRGHRHFPFESSDVDASHGHQVHLFITTLRTSPKTLLRLVRHRWAIENQWHWPRDTQLGEDAHHYAQRNGVQVLALLRTMALNLLRCNGFYSIRAGLTAVAHEISRMLDWVGIRATETGQDNFQSALPPETFAECHGAFTGLRLVYTLPNPIDRAWSAEKMDLTRAKMQISEASDQWFADRFLSCGSVQRGVYETCLKNWLRFYQEDQLLVLRFEELEENPHFLPCQMLETSGSGTA